jgi:tetratricopeptide (TPR) repeat protein
MDDVVNAPVDSRLRAPELWAELQPYRFQDQYHLVRTHRRFVAPDLCELLCRESVRLTAVDPERAVESAELAVLVSDLLKEEAPARLYQLRGYAWAHDANARRVQGDLRNADESFSIAEAWWEAGAGLGDALGYEPMFLEVKSSLRIAQRRFLEAFESLDRMYALYAGGCQEDVHLAGRTLIKKALALAEMGEPGQAIGLLRNAEGLVDAGRDLRLFVCLRHNLLWNLTTVEEYEEAKLMLPELSELFRELGNPLDLLRLRWAEGRVAAGLGQTDEAIQIFQGLQQSFAELGIAYDAALVTLELTALHAQKGSASDVKRLSLEMAGIFQAQDVPREALAALLFFQKAAERELASAKLAREIGAFLEKLRSDPGLRFERLR